MTTLTAIVPVSEVIDVLPNGSAERHHVRPVYFEKPNSPHLPPKMKWAGRYSALALDIMQKAWERPMVSGLRRGDTVILNGQTVVVLENKPVTRQRPTHRVKLGYTVSFLNELTVLDVRMGEIEVSDHSPEARLARAPFRYEVIS